MGILVADQNRVGFQYESGTYTNPTGGSLTWLGLVQNHTIDETNNRTGIRYAGTNSRDVSLFTEGMKEYTGAITYYPQNWKMLQFALGSIGTANGSVHTFVAVNSNDGNQYTSGTKCPFISFSLEDAQQACGTGQNYIRTLNGCMADTMTITASEGEPISIDMGYRAKDLTYSSGAVTNMTADNSTKPYMWSHSNIHLTSGTPLENVKSWSVSIGNNIIAPNYCDGSREVSVPKPLGRDYALAVTVDAQSTQIKQIYDQYYNGGSEFNALLNIVKSTSDRINFSLSGCVIYPFNAPTNMEGINEHTFTIWPKTIHPTAVQNTTYVGF